MQVDKLGFLTYVIDQQLSSVDMEAKYRTNLRQAKEAVNELIKEEKAREALSQTGDGWVRCEDGLPERNKHAEVWTLEKLTGQMERINCYWFLNNSDRFSHWQPVVTFVPSPPQNK